jgi:hypothetical protein
MRNHQGRVGKPNQPLLQPGQSQVRDGW